MKKLLAKIVLALALGLIVLAVLDAFNPTMAFLTSTVSKIYIAISCVLTVVLAAICIAEANRGK